MIKINVNDVVSFYRKQKGFTQSELASLLFVSEKTISAYETGKRGISTDALEQIAKVLEMEVHHFFDQEKIKEDMRMAAIEEVAVTIIGERNENNTIQYWVEVDVPETGETLEHLTSEMFLSIEEAENYAEKQVESIYTVINYHVKDDTHILSVDYTSEWDDGYAEFTTKARYNTKENTVFDIESANVDGFDLDICNREYITLPDGRTLDVAPHGEEEEYEEEIKNKTMTRIEE